MKVEGAVLEGLCGRKAVVLKGLCGRKAVVLKVSVDVKQ